MSTPATLLEDALDEAIIYLKANNGGNRAGLIADLVAVIGISSGTAGNWVDALTAEIFSIGMSTDTTYTAFKTWLQTVGGVRAEAGIRVAFEALKKGTLLPDSKTELSAKFDALITKTDSRIANANTAIAFLLAQNQSTSRDIAVVALKQFIVSLNTLRATFVIERDKLAG